MFTLGFLVVSLFVMFFAFMIYDVAQPAHDGVHKLGPFYWTAKRHQWCVESDFDNLTHKTFFSVSIGYIDLGGGSRGPMMLVLQFLFWSLYLGFDTK